MHNITVAAANGPNLLVVPLSHGLFWLMVLLIICRVSCKENATFTVFPTQYAYTFQSTGSQKIQVFHLNVSSVDGKVGE